MYGKLFASAFTGTMMGSGPTVFAVWAYAIANADQEGVLELNPALLAVLIGTTVDDIEQALDTLRAPDPKSRSQVEEGRRLIRRGQFEHLVVNYVAYRKIRSVEDRREYKRLWAEEDRKKKRRQSVDTVDPEGTLSTEAVSSKQKHTTTLSVASGSGSGFDLLWKACAKKVGKGKAQKAYISAKKRKTYPGDQAAVAALERLQATEAWSKDGRQYQPHLATWLNRDGWEDEIVEPAKDEAGEDADHFSTVMDRFTASRPDLAEAGRRLVIASGGAKQ